MPGLMEELRERNATTLDAAKELCRGLMRGAREELKLGYSWENAAMAAERMFELPKLDAHELKFYALGYARGMHGAMPNGETDLVEKIRGISERYADAYVAGRAAGLDEGATKYPASIPAAATVEQAAAEAPPTPPEMKTCGCGATTVGECAAAVEGYFTSLGQRSDEELTILGDEEAGDGCTAAQVVLAARVGGREQDGGC